MKHAQVSCLDLQFLLFDIPKTSTIEAKNIQKTIAFVNCVTFIVYMMSIIQDWTKKKDIRSMPCNGFAFTTPTFLTEQKKNHFGGFC